MLRVILYCVPGFGLFRPSLLRAVAMWLLRLIFQASASCVSSAATMPRLRLEEIPADTADLEAIKAHLRSYISGVIMAYMQPNANILYISIKHHKNNWLLHCS